MLLQSLEDDINYLYVSFVFEHGVILPEYKESFVKTQAIFDWMGTKIHQGRVYLEVSEVRVLIEGVMYSNTSNMLVTCWKYA